jgi:hypothetical protein
MKMPGVLLPLLFPFALFLAAQRVETTLPSVFDPPLPEYDAAAMVDDLNVSRAIAVTQTKFRLYDCNCTALVDEINVRRAVAVTEAKFRLQDKESWYQIGMGYVDTFHAGVTQTVHVFSANADRQLAIWTGDENLTKPTEDTPREGNASAGLSAYFDRLFFDDTYLYSQEASYLILRAGYEVNKKAGNKFRNQVRMAISLPKTQKHLQLFIGDPLTDNEQVINEQGQIDSTTGVGARYFIPDFVRNMHTSLSGGFRGILDPFVQFRVDYPMNFYDWLIRPVQYVEYSVKREFYEESDLYFDRRISRQEMIRLRLQRATETKKVGMGYSASITYYNTLRFDTAFQTYVSMAGRTQVQDTNTTDTLNGGVVMTPGIYSYSVGGGWKQSFLRRWLFYEINPRVDFDMQYEWRPNYVTVFWLDLYFGKD